MSGFYEKDSSYDRHDSIYRFKKSTQSHIEEG